MYNLLLNKIKELAGLKNFAQAAEELEAFIRQFTSNQLLNVLDNIGIIPESIEHDSTEEKLFSKVSDSVLAQALREIGLDAKVLSERGDSADVIAHSYFHNYDLVADAKAFRLSRTAKNQKDFKVVALSNWRKDSDYAVVVSPYFQYPHTNSQIYAQSIEHNVCLFSWEHLIFLIKHQIKESEILNLSVLWNFSQNHSENCIAAYVKRCFIPQFDDMFIKISTVSQSNWQDFIQGQIQHIIERGELEINFWKSEIETIEQYSREQAICELLKTKKIDSKITQIQKYTQGLKYDS